MQKGNEIWGLWRLGFAEVSVYIRPSLAVCQLGSILILFFSYLCLYSFFLFVSPLFFSVNLSYCLVVYLLEDSGLIRFSLVVIMRSCPISSSPTCIFDTPPLLKYRR